MRHVERTATELRVQNPNLPEHKAREKAASLWRGLLFLVIGLASLAFGGALMLKVVSTTSAAPSIGVLVFAGVPMIVGLYCVFAGGHIMSGEAMTAAAQSSGALGKIAAKLVNVARGKNGS
jgi:hypothetical protein